MFRAMRAGSSLTSKALLALEEACHTARYTKPDRTRALRFALAYLYALRRGDATPFYSFWIEIASDNDLLRFQNVNRSLDKIYERAGVPREDATVMGMWRAAHDKYGPAAPDAPRP